MSSIVTTSTEQSLVCFPHGCAKADTNTTANHQRDSGSGLDVVELGFDSDLPVV
jgi:hypothetical protein